MLTQNIVNHPTVGSIRGIERFARVHQFLGIQYATLQDRFSRGELLEKYLPSSEIKDATKFGPLPLSPTNGCQHEQAIIQRKLPFEPFHYSDTQCLTLNISVPVSDAPRGLPVMVFIHGGAFAPGSSSFPQVDLAPITNMSIETGKPMICVGINYRVGAPGFLYSSAMEAAGYKANNGLDDQKLALRWINLYISGFGGDPERVTVLGESAGAASGCFHLHSSEPLFDQLIALSGSSQQRLRSTKQAEATYRSVVEAVGATTLPPKEQLQKILHIPGEELVSTIGRKFPIGPLIDGEIIPRGTSFSALRNSVEVTRLFPGIFSCRRAMLGDCQMDGMAFASRVAGRQDNLQKTLLSSLHAVFDPINQKIAKDIASAYGLDDQAISNEGEDLEPVLHFGGDVMFALPAREIAQAFSVSAVPGTKAFLCHFNAPNPWEGPWKGHSTHILDISFALLNYNGVLLDAQRLCAERYARDIITFVNGGEPWQPYETGGRMVYDAPAQGTEDASCYVPRWSEENTGRREALYKIVGEAMFDKLVDVWMLFMAGPKR